MPDHEPGSALNVCPACADPDTVGGLPLLGAVGADCTTPVGAELALADPTEFEPVTSTLIVDPTSAETNV